MSELEEVKRMKAPSQKQADKVIINRGERAMRQGEQMRQQMGVPANRVKDPMLNAQPKAEPSSYKKGGLVKKTGMAKVHKGEMVLTKKQVAKKKASKSCKKK